MCVLDIEVPNLQQAGFECQSASFCTDMLAQCLRLGRSCTESGGLLVCNAMRPETDAATETLFSLSWEWAGANHRGSSERYLLSYLLAAK